MQVRGGGITQKPDSVTLLKDLSLGNKEFVRHTMRIKGIKAVADIQNHIVSAILVHSGKYQVLGVSPVLWPAVSHFHYSPVSDCVQGVPVVK